MRNPLRHAPNATRLLALGLVVGNVVLAVAVTEPRVPAPPVIPSMIRRGPSQALRSRVIGAVMVPALRITTPGSVAIG